MQLTLDIPEKFFAYQTPKELVRLLKLNTAIDLYRRGKLSAGAAAEFVGDLDRYEFLYECPNAGLSHKPTTMLRNCKPKSTCWQRI
ncbi:MAG: UPF0175 family protein [Thiolinea sp.]